MSAYFVTSTGTGVGKTFATCALLHAARARGQVVHGYKPIISGWDEGSATDTAQIIEASGGELRVDAVSPWRFTAPLSPHRAAALEGKTLDVSALNAWCKERLGAQGLTLIEGVGGVMVPLDNHETTLDWMQALGLPVILVVGSYLGTISHTLTALAALRSRGLKVAAIIMSESDGSTVTLDEAQQGLAPFIVDIPLRIVQPRVSSWAKAHAIHALEVSLCPIP
jgi:dethiobiotin synthetase